MFVAEDRLQEAWALVDAGAAVEEIERFCGGEEIKERLWKRAHKGCTTCARGAVHRTGVSGGAPVAHGRATPGGDPANSEVPVRGIARAKKRPAREAIPAGLVE